MKASNLRPLMLSYAIIAGLIALGSTFLQLPPALFFINLFAPEDGDTYPVTLVFLLTALLLLSPLFIYMAVARARRSKVKTIVKHEMTGIFVTRKSAFAGAMTPIPVFVNGEEVGLVDSGRTSFFQVPPGEVSIHAGVGGQASQPIRMNLPEQVKVRLEMELITEIFSTRVVLRHP